MKPSDQIIRHALDRLAGDDCEIRNPADNKIDRRYNGYISSFGGTIVQCGILQAVLAFLGDYKPAPGYKEGVCRARLIMDLLAVYNAQFPGLAFVFSDRDKLVPQLKDHCLDAGRCKKFRNEMAQVAVSYKLAMRTFSFSE